MRESHIGSELKEVAQEAVRFGERCVQAGRNWLNERRGTISNRNNEGRRQYRPEQDYEMGRHQRDLLQRQSRVRGERSERL